MSSPDKLQYPVVRKDEECTEDLHGIKVPDPYRWLENPDSDETVEFVKAQNEISEPFLKSCPIRSKFHSRFVLG